MNRFAPALAAACLLASAAPAFAHDASVVYGDLDLTTPSGVQAMDRRIARAARDVCRGYGGLDAAHCERAVRAEVMANLSNAARGDYARGRQTSA